MLKVMNKPCSTLELQLRDPHNAQGAALAAQVTCADLIVDYLERLGIERVFGVPGGAIEPFMNALARSQRRGGPQLIVARHECGAAFMADGYYRETGKMGVVCSTTGPGATNLITGVASAAAEETPLLVITAQTPLPKFGKRALQESSCTAIDTVGMLRYASQLSTLVSHQEQLEGKLVAAVMAALRPPRGPAHLSIPSDVLRSPASLNAMLKPELLMQEFAAIDEQAVHQLYEKIIKAHNIVIYIGRGVGAASRLVMELIERTGATFIACPMGKTWIDETHPQYRGVYGFAGHQSAKELLHYQDNIDLILALGTALGELSTRGWREDLLNDKLVHIDSTPEHFTRSSMANMHVYGNMEAIFTRLLTFLRAAKRKPGKSTLPRGGAKNVHGGYIQLVDEEKCLANDSPIKPQLLMTQLARKLPEDTRIFIDAGNSWCWATHYLCTRNTQGYYRIAMGYGSMGWAPGAAIGSAVANPQAPTLCIMGDGSYLMSGQEITVAAQHQLPVVFVILNDSAMGMVYHGQRLGNQESIGWELNKVNYAALAQAMGIQGQVIESVRELAALDWSSLFTGAGPHLLDIRIDREEVPPMKDRVEGLAVNASATPGG